jgi:hypothetical protein
MVEDGRYVNQMQGATSIVNVYWKVNVYKQYTLLYHTSTNMDCIFSYTIDTVKENKIKCWKPQALSWAASRGHGRLIRVLLDHKADPKLYSLDGQAPSDIAQSGGYPIVSTDS